MLLVPVLSFLWVVYFFETYLDYRQHVKLHENKLPSELERAISDDKFTKSRLYGLDKSWFEFFSSAFSQVEGTVILWYGGLALLWYYCVELASRWGFSDDYEVSISLLFIGVAFIYETIMKLPWELYSTFVIEEKHGFNKQTLSMFFSDKLKGIILAIVIGGPTLSALLHIIKWGGTYFYVYCWIFISVFTFFMLTIYPTLIAPLFNTFTPLQEGELKTEIENLAAKIHFPLTKLYVIDGSKRSGHSNAYFYGFYKNKRIVLYDTLMAQLEKPEIVAVLGHELGHWKLNHTIKLLLIGEIQIFVSFFLFGQILNWDLLYTSFGFSNKPIIIGFILFFQFIMSPVDHLLSFLMNMLSRRFEFQADAFGKRLGPEFGPALQSGLIKISSENLGNLNPDPWYSIYHYSHPPIVERLKALGNKSN